MADIPLEYTNMPCEVASKPQQSNFCSFLPLLRVVVSFEYLTQFVKIRDQARDRITSTVYILLPNLQTQRFVHLEPDKPPTFCSFFPTSQLHKTMAAVASDKADGQTQWEFSWLYSLPFLSYISICNFVLVLSFGVSLLFVI